MMTQQHRVQLLLMVALDNGANGVCAQQAAMVELAAEIGLVIILSPPMVAKNALETTWKMTFAMTMFAQWMVTLVSGANGAFAAGPVELEVEVPPGNVTIQLRCLGANHAKEITRNPNHATLNIAQLMATLAHGHCGPLAPRPVELESATDQGCVTTQPLPLEENHVLVNTRRAPPVILRSAQLMVDMKTGANGRVVAKHVTLEIGSEAGLAIIQNHNMAAKHVLINMDLEVINRMNSVILTHVQWMEDLDNGTTGLHALSLVELDLEIGRGNVTTLYPRLVANHALATSRNRRTATKIRVQGLVTGACGPLGASALSHVELGGTPGTGSVTILHLNLEDKTVKAKSKRRELATPNYAQLMDTLDFGATGVAAARLVVLGLEAETGSVTVLLLNMVASLALAISRKMNNVTPMLVQEMEHGANGSLGPPVIRPVALGGKSDKESATIHHLHSEELIARARNRKRLPVTPTSAQ